MVTRFKDEYMPTAVLGYPARVAPRWSTGLAQSDSGAEVADQRWSHPLRSIQIPEGVRDHVTFEALKAHWLVMAGPASTFPWRDPTDFATADLEAINQAPTLSRTDQAIATGDGATRTFQLKKTYTRGAETYARNIFLPVESEVLIGVDGSDPTTLSPALTPTITRYGGTVTFDIAPGVGQAITWGGLFDLEVRFEADDTFDGVMRSYAASGFADVPLQEVRFCG